MNVMIAEFRKQNIAHHDRFLARRGPAGQAQARAPIAFMHHAVADEIVVLTMVEHRQAEHPRVFDRAPHELVILNTVTVIRDRDDAGLRQRANGRQFFAGEIFRDAPVGKTFTQRLSAARSLINAIVLGLSATGDSIRHANNGRESAGRRRSRAGLDGFLVR